jgi:hypothetical protein
MIGQKGTLRLLSDKEITQRLNVDPSQATKLIGENTRSALENIVSLTNKYSQLPTMSGKAGAAKLMELRRALGESFEEFYNPSMPDSIKRLATQIKENMFTRIGQSFSDNGLGQEFIGMNARYSAKADAVKALNQLVDAGQVDGLVKHMVSKAGSYRSLKGDVQSIAELVPGGQKMINDVLDWEAAKGFVDFVPKSMGGNSAITIAKGLGMIAQQSNPRVVGRQIQLGSRLVDFLKALPPKQLAQLLQNDQAMASLITPVMQAYDGQDHQTMQLLQGAIGGQQSSPLIPGGSQ